MCKLLAESGFTPVVYDNLSRGHADAVRWGPLEQGDLADGERLRSVLRRYEPEAVIHFAGLIAVGKSVADPALFYRNNVACSLSLFDAMRDCGVGRIVFCSTAVVYGTPTVCPIPEEAVTAPINPYGHSKMMVERILADNGAAYGLAWMALRYFNAAGADPEGEVGERHDPETHLIPLVLDVAAGVRPVLSMFGDDYPTPDGTCVRDYIHVWDLARAHLSSLDRLSAGGASQAVNVGTGVGVSVAEIIGTARQVTGRPIPVKVSPRRAGDAPTLVSDPARANRLLDWRPAFGDITDVIWHAWRFVFRR